MSWLPLLLFLFPVIAISFGRCDLAGALIAVGEGDRGQGSRTCMQAGRQAALSCSYVRPLTVSLVGWLAGIMSFCLQERM